MVKVSVGGMLPMKSLRKNPLLLQLSVVVGNPRYSLVYGCVTLISAYLCVAFFCLSLCTSLPPPSGTVTVSPKCQELSHLGGFLTTSTWSQCQGRGTGFLKVSPPPPYFFQSLASSSSLKSTKESNL